MPRAEAAEGLVWAPNAAADGCVAQEMQRPRIPLATAALLFLIVIASSAFSGGSSSPAPPPPPPPPPPKVLVQFYSDGAFHTASLTSSDLRAERLMSDRASTAFTHESKAAFETLDTFMHTEGIFKIASFELIPWGHSYYHTSDETWSETDHDDWLKDCNTPTSPGCWTGTPVCSTGVYGCTANFMQSCAMQIATEEDGESDSLPTWWKFINCFEDKIDPDIVATNVTVSSTDEACRTFLPESFDPRALDECYKMHKQENEWPRLQPDAAKKTAGLTPRYTGQADNIIRVDGQLTAADQVLHRVCDSYQGQKPAACSSL